VVLVPPVSGGSPAAGEEPASTVPGDRFRVTAEPVAADDLVAAVMDETVGAVVTFVGVVRGFSRGKRVRYLEYEAYAEMAEQKLAEIAGEIRARWQVDRVLSCTAWGTWRSARRR